MKDEKREGSSLKVAWNKENKETILQHCKIFCDRKSIIQLLYYIGPTNKTKGLKLSSLVENNLPQSSKGQGNKLTVESKSRKKLADT